MRNTPLVKRLPGGRLWVFGLLVCLSLSLVVSGGYASPQATAAVPNPQSSLTRPETLVYRVYYRSTAERDSLAAEFGAEEVATTQGYLTFWTDRSAYNEMLSRGLRIEIDEAQTRLANDPHLFNTGGTNSPDTFYGGFKTVEEIYAFLDQQVANHPTLAAKVDFGDSWCKVHAGMCTQPDNYNGYDMFALHITNQAIPGPKPVFWYEAGIHAREIATPEIAMLYISWLLDNYNTDPEAHWLVDWTDIWVAPTVNPDGHHIVESGGGGSSPYYQRKNANNTNGCTTWPPSVSTQFGTDNNRNFYFQWNCCGGSSSAPCSQTYHGTGGNSEPETQAVVNQVRLLIPDQRGPNLTDPAPLTTTGVYQDMHSNASLDLYPWGFQGSAAPNGPELGNIAKHMSASNAYPSGNSYQACQPPNCLYAVDGDANDWAYGDLGAASYTTEVGGSDFLVPISYVQNTLWPQNKGALIYQAKAARQPYLLAHGPDANTVVTNPPSVPQGTPSQLTGNINFTWVGNTFSQNVAAAEYYIDNPPWAGGTAVPMTGNFTTPNVAVSASIDTSGLSVGRHIIFVRGRGVNDFQGSQTFGPVTAAFLDVTSPNGTPTPPTATPTTAAATATATSVATGTATSVPTNTDTPQPSVTGTPPTPPATFTAVPSATPCTSSFSDVSPSDYFYEAVTYLSCHGVISGYSDGTFRPYNNTTRGQLSKIVVLAVGWTIDTSGGPHFSDVPASNPFYPYIETAYHHGVISGYSDGTFRWGNEVTRGQLSKIIVESMQWGIDPSGGPHFSDVPPSDPFYNYIETAFNHGIISGYADGTFRPGNNATRGQISKIVYLALTSP